MDYKHREELSKADSNEVVSFLKDEYEHQSEYRTKYLNQPASSQDHNTLLGNWGDKVGPDDPPHNLITTPNDSYIQTLAS